MRLWPLRRHPPDIANVLWQEAILATPYIARLAADDLGRLRALATAFIAHKTFDGAAGLSVTDSMRVLIAARACLPILHHGLDWYENWRGIVIYPGDFRVREEYEDEIGVVHQCLADLCGQSIEHGPMVLSWQSIVSSPAPDQDLVIHECAHKLDTLNGSADGYPPLPNGMDGAAWTRDFSAAYGLLRRSVEAGLETCLDPYAAEHPAEFFAVASETFFTEPTRLRNDFPAVYRQLVLFYRHKPLATP